MSAAKYKVKASKPLEAYSGNGCLKTFVYEADLRKAQSARFVGKYVAFNFGDVGRVVGLCVCCQSVGKDEATGIPDFLVTVKSLKDDNRKKMVNLVKDECQFFGNLAAAKSSIRKA